MCSTRMTARREIANRIAIKIEIELCSEYACTYTCTCVSSISSTLPAILHYTLSSTFSQPRSNTVSIEIELHVNGILLVCFIHLQYVCLTFLLQELQSSCAHQTDVEERAEVTAQRLEEVAEKLEAERGRAARLERELLLARGSVGEAEERLKEKEREVQSQRVEWEARARRQAERLSCEQRAVATLRGSLQVRHV